VVNGVVKGNSSGVEHNKNCELRSSNKKVIGVHVDPPYVDIARSAYTNAFSFGPRDFATGGISQPSNSSPPSFGLKAPGGLAFCFVSSF